MPSYNETSRQPQEANKNHIGHNLFIPGRDGKPAMMRHKIDNKNSRLQPQLTMSSWECFSSPGPMYASIWQKEVMAADPDQLTFNRVPMRSVLSAKQIEKHAPSTHMREGDGAPIVCFVSLHGVVHFPWDTSACVHLGAGNKHNMFGSVFLVTLFTLLLLLHD